MIETTTETETLTALYMVPQCNLPELFHRIAKLNRKAARLHCDAIKVNETGATEMREFRNEDTREKYYVPFVQIELTGTAPRVNGWAFVATIRHDGETGLNVLATVPGTSEPLPVEYRTAGQSCDHCRANRRRNDTFVVRSVEGGMYKQIGRNCLADFLGGRDTHALASMAEYLAEAGELCEDAGDESWGGSSGRGRCYDLDEVVAVALAACREFGWVSSTEARNSYSHVSSTASEVAAVLNPAPSKVEESRKWREEHVTEREYTKAGEAIAWVLSLPEADLASDYLWNLHVVATKGTVDGRSFGLACSMPRAFNNELAKRAEREIAKVSAHVGTVGERRIFNLTITDEREIPSEFGVSTLYKFADADGNRFKWFASNPLPISSDDDFQVIGANLTLLATIKGHDEYKGILETSISRAKIATEADLAKAAKAAKKSAAKLAA